MSKRKFDDIQIEERFEGHLCLYVKETNRFVYIGTLDTKTCRLCVYTKNFSFDITLNHVTTLFFITKPT